MRNIQGFTLWESERWCTHTHTHTHTHTQSHSGAGAHQHTHSHTVNPAGVRILGARNLAYYNTDEYEQHSSFFTSGQSTYIQDLGHAPLMSSRQAYCWASKWFVQACLVHPVKPAASSEILRLQHMIKLLDDTSQRTSTATRGPSTATQ
jgi:hypothetical protein